MPFCKTQGIVVRKVHFSESSLILTFLTPDFGRVEALAKGAKRSGKKAPGVLDMACRADIVFLQKSGELQTLTEWDVTDYFAGLRRGLPRLYAADYAAELVRNTTERAPCPEVFSLLTDALGAFAEAADIVPSLFAFELRLLSELGYRPELDRCTGCGGPLGAESCFSPEHGGVLCADCRSESCVAVSPGALATMRSLLRGDFARVGRLRIGRTARTEIKRVVRGHLEFTWGRRPRMWPYLDAWAK